MKKTLYFIFLAMTTASTVTLAKSKFVETQKCGSAKMIKFESCENNSIEFSFENCLLKSSPQRAAKVICKDNTVVARYGTSEYRYEAVFEKKDDGWGAIEWQSLGALTQSQAAPVTAAPVTAAPVTAAPVTAAPVTAAPVTAAPVTAAPVITQVSSPWQWSGFVDLRLTSLSVKDQPSWDGNSESGYSIEDGKFAIDYNDGPTELIADIPFRRAKNIDLNPTMSPPDYGSNNSTLLFGTDKLQFFGKYKFTENFEVWMGQFDTPYGLELNDSKDRVFSKAGLVYDEMLPLTHTGLLLQTSFSGNSLKLFSANSNNKGTLGNSSTGDNNYEYGVAWGFSNEMLRFQIGSMSRSIIKANGTEKAARVLNDITMGYTLKWFSIDTEIAQLNDPTKNILTTTIDDNETAGLGSIALVTLNPWEVWTIGFRLENLQNAPSGSTEKNKMNSTGFNIRWKSTQRLETKFEFTQANFERLDQTKWQTQRGIFSALISF